MLTIRSTLPDGMLDCTARQIGTLFDGPTLIELPGKRTDPLFVSILIHGNEDVGLGAIQRLLRSWHALELPRSLMLLIGNVEAAKQGVRRLAAQPDYNRIWPGAESDLATPEARMMAEIHQRVIRRQAFAAIDLHNNTGRNPHYSVVCSSDRSVLALASLFTSRAVMFPGLPGTQTASFAGYLPAMTAECGQPQSPANEAAVAQFLARVFELETIPAEPDPQADLKLYRTIGVLRIRPEVEFGFGVDDLELSLDSELDQLNFAQVPGGTALGKTVHPSPIQVIDDHGRDLAASFLSNHAGELLMTKPVTPAMFTIDERVVRQDCLGYLMEPVSHL